MIPQEWIDAINAAIELWRDVDAEEIYGPAYCELQEIRSYLIEQQAREYNEQIFTEEMKQSIASLKQEAIEVAWAIEECGASVELTNAVTKASALAQKIGKVG